MRGYCQTTLPIAHAQESDVVHIRFLIHSCECAPTGFCFDSVSYFLFNVGCWQNTAECITAVFPLEGTAHCHST